MRFHALALVALAGGILLVSFGIGANPAVGSIAGTILAIGTLVVTAGYKIQKIPTIGRTVCRCMVILALITESGIGAFWIGSIWYARSRAIDLRSKIELRDHFGMRPDVDFATLDIDIPEERDGIELTFQATDRDPALGICAPFTKISATPASNGSSATEIEVQPDEAMWLGLAPGSKKLQLRITVRNTKDDANCRVNLSVRRAILMDK
ncbi:hypothetical protein BKM31_31275 [[Actinomadura] parvosata subsp. kistnae]|uniref:Uncharacterized protein n=1 Tax=[Actinomadura] parvosata subsp. kistnae TaxID=1909395 RepID=A0A1V0A578_9ACTN|nr:hypothetical protein BKM31_31275 [Nonomuraea sp. ATCC 55076]